MRYFSICFIICGCFENCTQPVKSKIHDTSNVVVLKQIAIDDSMHLYLYKLDGRIVFSTSYIAYEKQLCDINRDSFILKGTFENISIGDTDTLLIWSQYENSIDSTQASKFTYKKVKLSDSMFLNYDEVKKIYLNDSCEQPKSWFDNF